MASFFSNACASAEFPSQPRIAHRPVCNSLFLGPPSNRFGYGMEARGRANFDRRVQCLLERDVETQENNSLTTQWRTAEAARPPIAPFWDRCGEHPFAYQSSSDFGGTPSRVPLLCSKQSGLRSARIGLDEGRGIPTPTLVQKKPSVPGAPTECRTCTACRAQELWRTRLQRSTPSHP